jgi:hypothetical protein
MKKKEVYINRKNDRIGIVLDGYDFSKKQWLIQHVDFIDGKRLRSFLFEHADVKLIHKFYRR